MTVPDLDPWQQPNGFPTLDYFRAVAEALTTAGIRLEDWHNDEPWEAAFIVDRNLIDLNGGDDRPQRGAFLGWKCGEHDRPEYAHDFTGEGWFWCPCTDADKHGDYVCNLGLPYLAEPAQVAAAFAAALTADYGITFTPVATDRPSMPADEWVEKCGAWTSTHQRGDCPCGTPTTAGA